MKLYYNPKCSTCRKALALLNELDQEVEIIAYLSVGVEEQEVLDLKKKLGASKLVDLIREKEDLYKELNLATASEGEVMEALISHPRLLRRPILETKDRACIARPIELIRDFLK